MIKRLSFHIKVAFAQICYQNQLRYRGLDFEYMIYDQFFLSVGKFSGGNTLLVMIGMHSFEKKSLKSFAFSLQFKIVIYCLQEEVIF